MKTEEDILRNSLKQEMKIAIEQYRKKYKKVPQGIENTYTEANLTNDLKEVRKLHKKFFGYLTKSKNAKEKFK